MITYEEISDFFEKTRTLHAEGRAKFNIDDTCRWSFFFCDPQRENLVSVEIALRRLGYIDVQYLDPDGSADAPLVFLRADKIERQSVDSLFDRNRHMYALAAEHGVSAYDGMDVGEIEA